MEELRKNLTGNTLPCSNCHRDILAEKDYAMLENGSILCRDCYEHAFPECEFCGKRIAREDMKFWGDCLCCPDCYEGFNPSFNVEENEKETSEAYKAMCKKYLGRKSETYASETVELKSESDDCGIVNYKMEVYLDEEGIVTDISRLTAEILLGESERSSSWGSYIIRNEDYEDRVDDMMLNLDLE